mmetsp:Transcript_45722/g.74582  ORF Transcript_45722/g.74582 Transcript_45722/m.74582 type:complete len:845 (-) Transcript_45722:750-3284(-)
MKLVGLLLLLASWKVACVAAAASQNALDENIGGGLRELREQYWDTTKRTTGPFHQTRNLRDHASELLTVRENSDGVPEVALDIFLRSAKNVPFVTNQLRAFGYNVLGSFSRGRYSAIAAFVPVHNLSTIARLPGVLSVMGSGRPVTQRMVESPAIDRLNVRPLYTSSPGLLGEGITIGVISDSFDRGSALTTAYDDVTEGFLPGAQNPNGYTEPVLVIDDSAPGYDTMARNLLVDEGRAMLQLIHMIAPKARLCFASGLPSQVIFAQNILKLAGPPCNADILVDDLLYTIESFFDAGLIGNAVNAVAAQGVVYLSAAGNSNGESVVEQANFQPPPPSIPLLTAISTDRPLCKSWHTFASSASPLYALNPTPAAYEASSKVIQLFWDSPTGVDDFNYAQMDVYLIGDDGSGTGLRLIAASSDMVSHTTIPIQSAVSPGPYKSDTKYYAAICQSQAGTPPSTVALFNPASSAYGLLKKSGNPQYPSVRGHVLARGCIAVGAVSCTSGQLRLYSSHGPSLLKFDASGAEIDTCRGLDQKPDVLGCDGVPTSFFGPSIGFLDFVFLGTSAAAPNVGAVAALVLESAGGKRSMLPHEVREVLKATALGRGSFDAARGFGLVDASAAVREAPTLRIDVSRPGVSSVEKVAVAVSTTSDSATAKVSWAPPCDGGAVIYTYVLRINSSSRREVFTNSDESTYTLTGLKPGTTYALSVASMNIMGLSPYSPILNFVAMEGVTRSAATDSSTDSGPSLALPIPIIVGIAAGGAALVFLLVATALFLRRRNITSQSFSRTGSYALPRPPTIALSGTASALTSSASRGTTSSQSSSSTAVSPPPLDTSIPPYMIYL